MTLPAPLAKLRVEIEGYARSYGLDFYPTIFEVVGYKRMNEVAAYTGFATRFPHWTFGMEYDGLEKGYAYGLQKIYELVINNDPTYAYVMESNPVVDQKTVMAHVFGHADFFKNNTWFRYTDRRMLDTMANHGTRVRRYIERFGLDRVETFLDRVLSLDNLIDPGLPFMAAGRSSEDNQEESSEQQVVKLKAKSYMDGFINPEEYLEGQRQKIREEEERQRRFPARPVRDLLYFLLHHAPLEPFERDILSMIRDEAYYFAPQRQTKIMNEGWASFWHSKIMTTHALKDSEVIDYAQAHAGTMGTRPGALNPYKLGIELFRDIERRWNMGRFGKNYDTCDSLEEKANWNLALGLGREKIFEVRRVANDVTFIDAFLTEEFAREQKLFTYAFNHAERRNEIEGRDFKSIKQKLLASLTNAGQPYIYVTDANFGNRGELYLYHRHTGTDLNLLHARETLKNIQALWKRPVLLETLVKERPKLLAFDGTDETETTMEDPSQVQV